jgi:hypothetical protein
MQSPSFFNRTLAILAFPFKDRDWFKKLAIGFGVTLCIYIVPILPMIILLGYVRRIMKRIILEDGEPSLPEWTDWSGLLSEGVSVWGANMIYTLPVMLLMFGMLAILFIAMFSPVLLVKSDGSLPPFAGMLPILGMGVFMLCSGLMMIVSLAIGLLQAAALGNLVEKNSFAAAFQFSEWGPVLKKGFSAFLVAFLMLYGINFVGMFAIQILYFTIIFIFLLPIVWGLYAFLVSIYSHTLSALAYREARRRMAG